MKTLIFLALLPVWIPWHFLRKWKLVPATCFFDGHDWHWGFDDEDFQVFVAGRCERCGARGDGLFPKEPEYEGKEHSEGIRRWGFEGDDDV